MDRFSKKHGGGDPTFDGNLVGIRIPRGETWVWCYAVDERKEWLVYVTQSFAGSDMKKGVPVTETDDDGTVWHKASAMSERDLVKLINSLPTATASPTDEARPNTPS
jgi:hypothetical protein